MASSNTTGYYTTTVATTPQQHGNSEPSLACPTVEFLKNYTVAELREHCRDLGLTNVWCTTSELIDKIMKHTYSSDNISQNHTVTTANVNNDNELPTNSDTVITQTFVTNNNSNPETVNRRTSETENFSPSKSDTVNNQTIVTNYSSNPETDNRQTSEPTNSSPVISEPNINIASTNDVINNKLISFGEELDKIKTYIIQLDDRVKTLESHNSSDVQLVLPHELTSSEVTVPLTNITQRLDIIENSNLENRIIALENREGWQEVTNKRHRPTWPGQQRIGQEQKKQMFWQDKQRGPIHQVSQGRNGLDLNNPNNNQSGNYLHAQARPQFQATPPPHRQAPSRPPHHLQARHRTPTIHQTSYSPTRHSEYYNNNNSSINDNSSNDNIYYTHQHGVRSPTTTIQPRIPSYPHLANNTGTSDTGRSSIHQVIREDNYDQDYPPLPPPTQLPTTRGDGEWRVVGGDAESRSNNK
ncbi:hypothetical protein Pmani_009577 [Petrolisthes manimaculis]|uniref:Uncharacterized protein n=1 Tax=Petrolisthes manimaculis TaxID=1843537 RepID=A0AAE1UI85_9EUCA|nr:hypothetical protein Pmani_009577 [Petrolisthes manimaculis]